MLLEITSNKILKIVSGEIQKKLPIDIQQIARRKIRMIINAQNFNDVEVQPLVKRLKSKGKMTNTYIMKLENNWRLLMKKKSGNVLSIKLTERKKY
ncbi:hypothetical protein ACFL6I_11835 [candidate division KSB1 bacterium]